MQMRLRTQTRPTNVDNIKSVTFSAKVAENVYANGFCFITTGKFRESLKNILPESQLARLAGLWNKSRVRRFEQYDSYCGLSAGKTRKNGKLKGRVSREVRASVFIAVFEGKKQTGIRRDAAACRFVSRFSGCFKTIPSNVQTTENTDGSVTVTGAVTGLAGCYEFFGVENEQTKSIVVSFGNVPNRISSQSNTNTNNTENESKSCNDRGFYSRTD